MPERICSLISLGTIAAVPALCAIALRYLTVFGPAQDCPGQPRSRWARDRGNTVLYVHGVIRILGSTNLRNHHHNYDLLPSISEQNLAIDLVCPVKLFQGPVHIHIDCNLHGNPLLTFNPQAPSRMIPETKSYIIPLSI